MKKILFILVYVLLLPSFCLGGDEVGIGGGRAHAIMSLRSPIIPIERNLIEDLQLDDGTILTAKEFAKSTLAKEEKQQFLFNLKGPVRDIMLKDGEIIDLVELREKIEDQLLEKIQNKKKRD